MSQFVNVVESLLSSSAATRYGKVSFSSSDVHEVVKVKALSSRGPRANWIRISLAAT